MREKVSRSVMLVLCQRELEYERHMKRPVEGDLGVTQLVLYRGCIWAFFATTPSATSSALLSRRHSRRQGPSNPFFPVVPCLAPLGIGEVLPVMVHPSFLLYTSLSLLAVFLALSLTLFPLPWDGSHS